MSIKRIALLIAYQEKAATYSSSAKGMQCDAENYKKFLKSPCGGAWYDSEIILKLSPSKQELLQLINNFAIGKDYAIIGFFGHGSYSECDDDIMLQINPTEQISALALRNRAPKALIVLDCCRAIPAREVIEEGVEHFASQRKFLDIIACQEYYEKCIMRADKGNTVLYACSPYEKSFGDAHGGIYTRNLLRVAEQWEENIARNVQSIEKYFLSVVEAHIEASKAT